MRIVATYKTATLAGIWSASGLITFQNWVRESLSHLPSSSVIPIFIGFALVFVFVPVALFVYGPDSWRFGLKDIFKREYWAALKGGIVRSFFWGLAGWVTLMLIPLLENVFAI